MTALNTTQERLLSEADRTSVETAMSNLKSHWTTGRWLSGNNRYHCQDVAEKVKDDSINSDSFQHSQLSEYVAASAIVHCFDGWSYLARALEAELTGDPDAARHLGYYAELRAAMSILAGEGIGVFNRHHVVILESGECKSIRNMTTHVFTWAALEYWAGLPTSTNMLFKAIRPAGIPLREWLDSFGGSASFVANAWLKQWGLDLSRLSDDRDARNLASYRPTAFISSGPHPIYNTVHTVANLWYLCSPGVQGEFSSLDRHLLRLGVNMLFNRKTRRSRKNASIIYTTQIEQMVNNQLLSDSERNRIVEFLSFNVEQETPELLTAANRQDQPTHIDHSRQVLARATLLLRVATGSLLELLGTSDTTFRRDLEFWWSSPSVRRRLWPASTDPSEFTDLWQDVHEALQLTENWLESSPSSECGHSFWMDNSVSAAILSTPERIFLWGVSQ